MRRPLLSLTTALLFVPALASAHIHLTYPLARTDSQTGDQKEQHCGVANQQRNPARVTTLRPGQTITVTWLETIQHPGYFRIAFQPNGATFGIPPGTLGPCVTGNGATVQCAGNCNFPTANQEGPSAGGSIILKDRIPDGQLSTQITLPDMECDNCTLQFIQVMTDKCPYTEDTLSDDIYFNCADITLSNSAPDAGPSGVDAGAMPDGGGGGTTTSGGCASSGGGAGLGSALALLGLAFAICKRRR